MLKPLFIATLLFSLFVNPVSAQRHGRGGVVRAVPHSNFTGHPYYNYGARPYRGLYGVRPYYYGAGGYYNYSMPYYYGGYSAPVFIGFTTNGYGYVVSVWYNPSTGTYFYQ